MSGAPSSVIGSASLSVDWNSTVASHRDLKLTGWSVRGVTAATVRLNHGTAAASPTSVVGDISVGADESNIVSLASPLYVPDGLSVSVVSGTVDARLYHRRSVS
jgi:hypothetical protein